MDERENTSLQQELQNLYKRQSTDPKWDPAVDGKRLIELQSILSGNLSLTPQQIELTKKQTTAGTVVGGKRVPELTQPEHNALSQLASKAGKPGK